MPSQSDLRLTFTLASGDAQLDVVSFTLDEGLSTTFTLKLELSSESPDIDFAQLLDHTGVFTILRNEQPVRYVHGRVSSFVQRQSGLHRTRYQAVIEPDLARAGLRSNWRIFQQKTVPQIIEQMLRANHITHFEVIPGNNHQSREYCVQAGETDLQFIARLAAEEGLLYAFEHTASQHRLVFTDQVQRLGTIECSITTADDGEHSQDPLLQVIYQPNAGGDPAQPSLHSMSYCENVRSSTQVQRDYTFKHPEYDQQQVARASDTAHQATHYEQYRFPGDYKNGATGKPFTEIRLKALRHDAAFATVQGDDARLQPGLAFGLIGHPRAGLNRRWRTVSAQHQGSQITSQEEDAADAQESTRYQQTAVLVSASKDWKAALPPRPRIDGPQIARVVGPKSEEIYCDEWGRVKLSFPWDREGNQDQFSSCWVRVAQTQAGPGWGSMAIPRVGQEVIVSYLNGDPDQPVVTGRTYCATNPPPYELPRHKTRMVLKSKTHKGEGFNELRFEDELGVEELFIHAQKDQNNQVNNDETTVIGRNRVEEVGNDEQVKVGNNHSIRIGNQHELIIGQSSNIEIGADREEKVGNTRTDSTHADHNVHIGGNHIQQVDGLQDLKVGNGMSHHTTTYELTGTQRLVFRSPGGSITLDENGVTVEGLKITMKGPVNAGSAGGGNALALDLKARPESDCREEKRG